ncbi:FG-GAP-like repeat-containing protein [Cyclobacterium jeungdonense]|uniref:FG-GAP-like repeat-containing protein n=1 Tax=Cyclobacterium jeungdonense TaxID=708087 RepID=A0ABT8C3X2_9BACT|nr:FG-GAP-like repeat-containing protein [Cyclobacterium jeungdonense]MDN3686460.1 FG-GAP-like repeat-containing protein [Cyclobacterium jeungdonense]
MVHWLFSLVVINAFSNDPNPSFKTQVLDEQVEIGYGLAIGDVDGDGKPDILLADKKQFVWYRNGDWKRFVMIDNLTQRDNVCIAARDINGDGQVEVAVGAQWNPGETTDEIQSGSVHYLMRPKDPTQKWEPVKLHHEPTVHRMRWIKAKSGLFHLIMLPLHGRGNSGGEGAGVKVIGYEMQDTEGRDWSHWVIDQSMHITHNMEIVPHDNQGESLYIGGKEGVKAFHFSNDQWEPHPNGAWLVNDYGFGEIRVGKTASGHQFLTGVEPFHGPTLSAYLPKNNNFSRENLNRQVLTAAMNQGHGLATGDLLGMGKDQIVIGWREPNDSGETGIKLFYSLPDNSWQEHWVDKNGMACEDLKVADLNGDGKPEIIASGRATGNLKIYWNTSN